MALAVRPLSVREMDVVRLVVEGRSNRQISDDLLVSSDTVKTHLRNIFRKCEVRNRAGLVAWWFERFNLTAERGRVAAQKGHPIGSRDSRCPVISRLSLAVLIVCLGLVLLMGDSGLTASATPSTVESVHAGLTRWSSAGPGNGGLAVCSSASHPGGPMESDSCVTERAAAQELPAIRIVSPEQGQQVTGPGVDVGVEVGNFILVPPSGTGTTPDEGHIIYYLDFEPPFAPGQSAIPIDPTVDYAATDLLIHTFANVVPGPHKVTVMLVYDDHTPVIPPAINSAAFHVTSSQETPAPQPSPAATEVARTFSIGEAVVQTPRAAALPAVMPAVGGSDDTGLGTEPGVADWRLAVGAALVVFGGATALVYSARRNRR